MGLFYPIILDVYVEHDVTGYEIASVVGKYPFHSHVRRHVFEVEGIFTVEKIITVLKATFGVYQYRIYTTK